MKTNTVNALALFLMGLSLVIGMSLVACMKVGDGIGVDENGSPFIAPPDPCIAAPTSKGCPQDPCVLDPNATGCVTPPVDSCTLPAKPARCTVVVDSCTLPLKPERCNAPTGPSFAKDILPILTASCEECHNPTGTAASTKLLMTKDVAYANLVNVASTEKKTYMRILPGKADSSYLYLKISQSEPPMGGQMPLYRSPLSKDKIELIKNWINSGALP